MGSSVISMAGISTSFFRYLMLLICCGAISASAAEPAKRVIVLGDSIAAGYGVDPEEAFPSVLQKRVDAEGLPYKTVNAGVSGDTTAGGARRIGWVLKQPVDILVIELGGNDGLRGIAPAETQANLEKIIDAARGSNAEVKILLAGMQMPQNMGADYTEKFKAVFPAVAEKKKVTLIPFVLEGVGGKPELNQPDRIHPNAKGHQIVADNVWMYLKPLLKKS
jgi:acyl-CoA thioesterase-1